MTPHIQVRREAGAAPGERIYVGIDVGYREHVAAGIPLSGFQRGQPPDGWKRVRPLHFSSDAVGPGSCADTLINSPPAPLTF